MAKQEILGTISLPVAADYSSTGIYRFVNVNSSSQAELVSAAGGSAIGVLQGNPDAAGKMAPVAVYGKAKVYAGGTVAAGAKVQADANAAAITAASGDEVLGVCVVGGDSGELIEVLLVSNYVAP